MSTIVVGGGIAACAVALALRSRGSDVTLIEGRASPGAATPASAGMVAPQYESDPSDPTFALGVESRARYAAFLDAVNTLTGADLALVESGMLVANQTAAETDAAFRAVDAQRAHGLEARMLEAGEAARIEPAASTDVGSYTWLPASGWLDSRRLAEALPRAAEAAGARRVAERATGLLRDGDRAVGLSLEGGAVEGDQVVLAAGCWSPALAGLPRRVPVRPVRGQMLHLDGPDLPARAILADHCGGYLVPRKSGALAGSTMDDTGFDCDVTGEGSASIRRAVGRLCPAAGDAPAADSWAGLRPLTPDGLPIVGPDPLLSGLFYATGYGRSGILLAPLLADVVADLVQGREPEFGWLSLAIDRFDPVTADPSTGRE